MNNQHKAGEWKIIIPPRIAHQLKKLSGKEQSRIRKAIDGLRNFPKEGDLKRLEPNPEWRLKSVEGEFFSGFIKKKGLSV